MYVCGKNVANQLIDNNKKINKIFLSDSFSDAKIQKKIEDKKIVTNILDKRKMNKIIDNNQGIILEIDDYKLYDEKYLFSNLSDNPFIVILDHIEDTHNFGAIIRTCESAGVDFLVIPKNRSVKVNSTVIKTSTGAIENIKIVSVTNLNNFIKTLKKHNIWVYCAEMDTKMYYDDADFKMPTAIVIGSEGFGISKLVMENCDFIVKIPMYGKTNSLNASVAAGIFIYEVIRQRRR